MSLENVKVGDWIKVQVTDIVETSLYPIQCDRQLDFMRDGRISISDIDPIAFPLETTERWMMVSENDIKWHKRKVIMEKNGKFLAWDCAETDKEVAVQTDATSWNFAKEIEEVPEYTMEELTKIVGKEFKIKK